MKLVIGDRNFSSWSLRPWLVLKQAGLPFEEIPIRLREAGTKADILKHSPSGKVPCLIDGEIVVWDSLAIGEYLAEKTPGLWPADAKARAVARAVSAEMHSGFTALRTELSMEVNAYKPHERRTASAEADIARIVSIWQGCRKRFGARGPFLFGDFSIADAMYAPVVWRFLTYAVSLPPEARAWMEMMAALPAMKEWHAGAVAETASL